MAKSVINSLLVIGENHEEIAKKYSLDTEVEPYVRYKREDAEKLRKQHLKFIDGVLTTDKIKFTVNQRQAYKDLYQEINDMDDFDYYLYITEGCTYDMETMDAISKVNPNAEYRAEKCYDARLKNSGIEANLTTPFTLKDGTRAYIAKKGDIDWSIMHMRKENIRMYTCAWDVVVNYPAITMEENEDPEVYNARIKKHKDEWIKANAVKYDFDYDFVANIYNNMCERGAYFACFDNVEDYVEHSASFWTNVVATEDKCYTVSHKISDKEWTKGFFKKFIEPLPDDTIIALYEVRTLDD